MNKSNIEHFKNIPYLSPSTSRKVYGYMMMGSEWVKRDALRAFHKAFDSLLDIDKEEVYNVFTRAMFTNSDPIISDTIIMNDKLNTLINEKR